MYNKLNSIRTKSGLIRDERRVLRFNGSKDDDDDR